MKCEAVSRCFGTRLCIIYEIGRGVGKRICGINRALLLNWGREKLCAVLLCIIGIIQLGHLGLHRIGAAMLLARGNMGGEVRMICN